jgi:hypothetical protein
VRVVGPLSWCEAPLAFMLIVYCCNLVASFCVLKVFHENVPILIPKSKPMICLFGTKAHAVEGSYS